MLITRLDPAADAVLRGCHAVRVAVLAADDPHGPDEPYGVFATWLKTAFGDPPGEPWVAFDEPGGEVIGYYRIDLPDRENLDTAFVFPNVRPELRRRGIGSELLRHAAARAVANGRTVLRGIPLAGSPGAAFAAHAGANAGLVDVRRALHLRKLPDGLIAGRRAEATAASAGYTLMSWVGSTPPEYWERLAEVLNAFGDRPADEGFEHGSFDADRVRAQFDLATRYDSLRRYSVAALHEGTGEIAALTQLYVTPEAPGWAMQGLTVAARAHRGHRLGLLVKSSMLEWLAAEEPGVEHIVTDNADSNEFMIAVNELLGFEVLPPAFQWYQMPAAAVK